MRDAELKNKQCRDRLHHSKTCGTQYWTRSRQHVRYPQNKSSFSVNHPRESLFSLLHSYRNPSKQTTPTLRSGTTGPTYGMTVTKVCFNISLSSRGNQVLADTLARLSVYTVPSDAGAYTGLLPHFLPPRTALPHTLVMIVLDWTRPWTFVEDLQTWLKWVEDWVKADGSREMEIAREENHERRTSFFFVRTCAKSVEQYRRICNIIPNQPPTRCPPRPT